MSAIEKVPQEPHTGHSDDAPAKNHQSLMKHFIGSCTHLPHMLVDNKFILKGYRINYDSSLLNLKSLFHKHNELINVWTHLIGALIAIAAIIYIHLNINELQVLKENIYKDVHVIFDPVWTEITDIGYTTHFC
jgi:adiponectin receptor